MGARGPVAQPTALKKALGNPGCRPLNTSEPTPAAGLPDPPECLSEQERVLWDAFARQLSSVPGLLTVIDGHVLHKLVSLECDFRENDAELKKTGHLYKDPSGRIVKSPRLAIKQELADQLRQLYREMGLTASARANIHMTVAPPKQSAALKMIELAKSR